MSYKNPTKNSILSLGCLLLLAVGVSQTTRADYPSTVLSQAPVAYYRLSETIKPQFSVATNSGSLGSAADGMYSNLPSLDLPGPFTGSSSVGFDGVSQYAYTPWVAGLNTSAFSFEIWAKPALVPNFAYLASSAELNSPRSGWYFAQDNGSTFGYGSAWVVRFFNTNAATPSVTLHATNSTAGVWTHLVITYDGTTAILYTNGVAADTETTTTNAAGLGYVPNVDAPFTVGIRSSINFEWPGQAAEAAIYPGPLTAARVAAHYAAGTSAPATYVSTILADSPLLFDQYQAPVQPPAVNSGTLGAAGNGLYLADASPGSPGPVPPMFPGFEATNTATAFDAEGGAVSLPVFNFNTNTITISCWVNATNIQLAGAGLVVCDAGTTGAGLIIDGVNGGYGLGYYWNNDPNTYNFSPTSDAGLETLPDSQWAYVALVIQPTEADIYIALTNGAATFMSVTNYYNHVPEPFDGVTLIGTDAGNPATSFNGAIDEVAIWNRSLSSGDLYSQFASAVGGLAPILFGDPPSPSQPIVAGNTLTLQANVGGTPPLSFQWFSNSVAVPWGTNAVYAQTNFNIAADSGSYFVIVTNLYGSATSGVATVTGQLATAPVIVSEPAAAATIYPDGVLNLPVQATGGGLVFQWILNGTNLTGATSPTYYVGSVSNVNAGSYSLAITNALGGTNIGPFVITVPTLTPGSYPAVVDADAPLSWWRLDDLSATNGAIMQDAMGRNSGVYTNFGGLTLGNPGAISGPGAGTAATFNGDGSYGYVPFFSELGGTKFTLEIWAKQTNVVNDVTAVSSFNSSGDGFGIEAGSFWEGVDPNGGIGSAPGAQAAGNPNWDPTIRPGEWVHLVIEYNPPGSSASYPYQVYVNGYTDGFIWSDNSTPPNTTGPFIIGGYGTGTAAILKNYFVGSIDEVAFYNKILTSDQIQAHLAAGLYGQPPTFTDQPQSQAAFVGQNVTLSVTAAGPPPIALQWQKDGVSLPGQTNNTLALSNLTYAVGKDVYSVLASNIYSSTLSSNAVITVYAPPSWINVTNGLVLHLTFDTDYNDSSGRNNNGTAVGSPTLVAGIIGSHAVQVSTDTGNGLYNYVTLGTPSDLLFGATTDFSVSYWVQFPAGALPGDLPFLCNTTNSTGGFGLSIVPAFTNGGWAWSLYDVNNNGAGVQGPANTINDGNWHNVVETFTRTSNCLTYLDGELVNSTPISGIGSPDTAGPYNIGQDPTGAYQQSATFALDDMGVWRRALTDYEARGIYLVGQNYGKSFDSTGPVDLTVYPAAGGQYTIIYPSGTLSEAPSITGPWTPVAGASPPSYQFTPTSTNAFFKVGP